MNAKIKIMLMLILLIPLVYVFSSGTFSYFSDVETSTGNTFTAGTWNNPSQVYYLEVDTSAAELTGEGKNLSNIILNNTGTNHITIDKLIVSWTLDGGEKIEEVRIEGCTDWSGSESSGTELDITDCIINPSETKKAEFEFDSDMSGKSFTIKFIMGDASSKEVP